MLRSIFLIFCVCFLFVTESFAAINYTVTPIRYELDLEPGESITLPASIRNNGTDTVTLPTTKSDFQANGPNGVPSIVRKSELVYPDQELSTWISLSDNSITLAPSEEGTIDFTIDVPLNATPGGHYGAVLFRNPGSETSTAGSVGINVDYGIIILVNVAGEIEVEIEIEEPVITNTGGGGGGGGFSSRRDRINNLSSAPENDDSWLIGTDENGNPVYQNPDDCTLGDFSPSSFDGVCFAPELAFENINNVPEIPENPEENSNALDNNSDITENNEPTLFFQDFGVDFEFPMTNNGNTHVKPVGKVTLTDPAGNVIPGVGKKIITNNAGAIIGEEVVDYLPINDEGGNILPKTDRVFETEWKGFPFKSFDSEGNQIIEYKDPSEYYTDKNKREADFLMLWERVEEVYQNKDITANIEIEYTDEKGRPIVFSAARDFPVQYVEQQVRFNPYIIFAGLLFFTALMLLWFIIWFWIIAKRRRKCWNCKKKIAKHWDTCPYCETLQNKKKQKQFLKQSEAESKKKKKK